MRRVARQDRRGRPVDVAPVGDVAELVLAAELRGQGLQPLLPAGDEHAVPALPRQLPRGRGADPAGRTGDHGHPHAAGRTYWQTRTTRCASALRPFASVTIARSVCLPFAAPPRFQTAEKRPAPPCLSVASSLLAVEEADRADRGRRGREHDERRLRRRALVRLGRDPGDRRAVDDGDVAGGEGGVGQQLVADGVDVLRLLEVGGGAVQQPLPGLQRRCLLREREERDPADRVVRGRSDQGAPVADHERIGVDARAEVEDAERDRRAACRDAARDQAEQRRLQVVHPGAEDVRPAQRAAGELIPAGVDRDVVGLRAREHRRRGADVERIVDRQVVDVHRRAGVALNVVLVRRAEHPRVDRAIPATRRSPPRRR